MKKRYFKSELFSIDSPAGKITLLSLAIPILFEYIMNTLQGTVNTAVLSGYSDNAVGAVGAVNPLVSILLLFTSVISMGITVVVSNYLGAQNIKKAQQICFSGIAVSTGVTLLLCPLLLALAPTLMRLLNLSGEIYSFALTYFIWRVAFLVTQAVTTASYSILRCYGKSNFTFVVGFAVNIINLLLNIVVIYYPQYSPAMNF